MRRRAQKRVIDFYRKPPPSGGRKRHGRGRVQKFSIFLKNWPNGCVEKPLLKSRKMGTRVTEKDIVIEGIKRLFNYI